MIELEETDSFRTIFFDEMGDSWDDAMTRLINLEETRKMRLEAILRDKELKALIDAEKNKDLRAEYGAEITTIRKAIGDMTVTIYSEEMESHLGQKCFWKFANRLLQYYPGLEKETT